MDTWAAVMAVNEQRPDLIPVLRGLLFRPTTFTVDDLAPDAVALFTELGLIQRCEPSPHLGPNGVRS